MTAADSDPFFVCVTFDVDLVVPTSSAVAAEMKAWRKYVSELRRAVPDFRATVFLRADRQLQQLFGRPDHIFRAYDRELRDVRSQGHEVGWHPHSYSLVNGRWIQNTDEERMMTELEAVSTQIDGVGLKACRMGWGFHTNKTMELVDRTGFKVDSSAIPRPVYKWEETVKDWAPTPDHPYRPSRADYRIPGDPALDILEVPMSVLPIPGPADTEPNVRRYINLAYWPGVFAQAVETWASHHNHLVTITHAHELLGEQMHPLFSPHQDVLETNLRTLERVVCRAGKRVHYITVSDFAEIAPTVSNGRTATEAGSPDAEATS